MRFLHTADWQIGMRARHAGSKAEVVREARLIAAERVVALARDHRADALLLAGDTFEDNAVDAVLVRRVVDILRRSACPVFLLPGNHDPLGAGSVYSHAAWREAEPQVRVLRSHDPVAIGDALLLPCPCAAKFSSSDPTLRIPTREGDSRIRIGVAHGSLRDQGFEVKGDDYPIAANAAERSGVDYLALGHWHSTLVLPSLAASLIAYSGTHETTSFGERDSGNCLLVTIERAGAPVRVEVLKTGGLTWVDREVTVSADDDVSRLRAEFDGLASPELTLLRLRLDGLLGPAGFDALGELQVAAAARFLLASIERDGVVPRPGNAAGWLAALPDGVARTVAERLLAEAETETNDRQRAVAVHALARLVALARQVSS